MIKQGEFGPVWVEAEGCTGYYDDDEWNEDSDAMEAVVYFGVPFEDGWFLYPYADLKPYSGPHLPLERWCRDHPDLAATMGVVRRQ